MHLSLRTLGGDVLHFARPVAIKHLALKDALHYLALRSVEFLSGGEHSLDPFDRSFLAVRKRGEARDRRCISEDYPRPNPSESLRPVGHLRFARMKGIKLVHPPRELTQFKFHPGHGIQFVVSTPEERDHLSRMPATLHQVSVRSGVARRHVLETTKKLEWHSRRSAAEVGTQFFQRDVLSDQVALFFPDAVFREDGKLNEIIPVANVLTANSNAAKHCTVVGNMGFSVRQQGGQFPELSFADFFG